ncbi:MAG TPA: pirin family protein [Nevskiaceae bacterium]|nr:pirin family protein [Nevskiaceae bacterium]
MISLRRSDERGHAEHGWLDARHTFSFSDYHDPRWMGYGDLRVINEDRVAPGAGFAPHGHRDMEIITYMLDGALAHHDSTGGAGVLRPGEVQVMSAGRGVRHSETNASQRETAHLLQIWIEPRETGVAPAYAQAKLDADALRAGFSTIVAPHGESAPFHIHQDARLSIAWPAAAQTLTRALDTQRRYYLHVARGNVLLGGFTLASGDAAMIEREHALELRAEQDSELLLFDLA